MIFVILGTQDKPFYRLIEGLEEAKKSGKIKDSIIVQAGCTKYKSNYMKIIDYMDMEEFEENIKNANVIITHAGVGSIISAIKQNKKVIAVARLKKYKEHVNDHQLQILENFSEEGYILRLDNMEELPNVLNKVKQFVPRNYKSNNEFFVNKLNSKIDEFLK